MAHWRWSSWTSLPASVVVIVIVLQWWHLPCAFCRHCLHHGGGGGGCTTSAGRGHCHGTETTGISCGEGADTYLGVGDVKCGIDEADGIGSHVGTSTGYRDLPSVKTDAETTENKTETVSIP